MSSELPLVLCGPILRRVEAQRVVWWLAASRPLRLRVRLDADRGPRERVLAPGDAGCRQIAAGEHLHYLLLDLTLDEALPEQRWIGYDIAVQPLDAPDAAWQGWREWAPDLCYPGREGPGFVFAPQVASLLYGSCRKPHFDGGDGLAAADELLARRIAHDGPPCEAAGELPAWPSALVLCGDQVYCDDVAGPMLRAIHALIPRLGLPPETLDGTEECGVGDSEQLYAHPDGYYRRERLLPRRKGNAQLVEILFGGVEKPIFTTDSAHNHLIALAEVLAMYLLAWSPSVWEGLELDAQGWLDAESRALFERERGLLDGFVRALPAVRRLFAHLPVAMIFDDHDVTDDWNLSREWEEVAYGHPFSRRVVGNAIVGYLIHQGWGNRPEAFDDAVLDAVADTLARPGGEAHETCIDRLLKFRDWHYTWPTTPPLVVIDTRTHRWRSETAARRPSGLMDWESITDLQQELRDHPAVLMVSPAPIFGVKLIETLQRIVTWCGHPLTVDAENWMAHPGAAHAILNVFRHPKTPQHFVVLSGDVHYSFVYDVELRGREHGPDIWQICSSGLRNEFPPKLLDRLDRANRWLYSPRSPLNWFTRRRNMRVIPRKPEGTPHGRRLLNGAGVGLVEIDAEGVPWRIREVLTDGRMVKFTRRENESRWR
ncbi:alkaline phosphatase D family protein [Pseudazoarcus pumilus]|nr:alkaline phosphatase D family protein [Pseudazoarcus pumilus]